LLPKVTSELENKNNILSVPYGFFVNRTDPTKGWGTFNHQPYYSTNYWGLRNRFAILNENYAYADYKTRIQACYHFIEHILEYTNNNGMQMLDLIRSIDAKTIERGLSADTTARFGTEIEVHPFEKPLLIRSYKFETYQDDRGRNRIRKTDVLRNYEVPFFADFKIKRSVLLPKGYLFSSNLKEIARKLKDHGIIVEQLEDTVEFEVQAFQIKEISGEERIYQGHRQTTIEGECVMIKKEFPENTYFVGMDQPLANLIAYLLEPESDGGLVKWNFFDRYLHASQWSRGYNLFPVYKLIQPVKVAKTVVQ
jgi:hypothetical protein